MTAGQEASVTLTRVRVGRSTIDITTLNWTLANKRIAGAVPVLSPLKNASHGGIERTTENPEGVKVRLVPLDREVPPPPGFDGKLSRVWVSVTPYVPPRHHLRGGKEREGESMAEQISRELQRRRITESVEVELVGYPLWVSVHVPRRESNKRAFIGDRRGQMIRLRFAAPVTGPIRLGHSSSFGLGLFRCVKEQ